MLEIATIYLLYNALLLLMSPAMAIMLVVRLARGKSRTGWAQRIGGGIISPPPEGRPCVWLHAASVGEVIAAQPILVELRRRQPDCWIWMTVITPGGLEVAGKLVGGLIDGVGYAPFDYPTFVFRALRRIRPQVLAIMETEIWPNLLYLSRAWGARLILLNGRISDRSFPKYQRIRWIVSWALQQFHFVGAQSDADAERLKALGAEGAVCLGNTKFDQADQPLSSEEREDLRQSFGFAPDAPILVAGSTRSAEEEAILLQAYILARKSAPNLALLIAPRHIERADALEAAMKDLGLRPSRRSTKSDEPTEQLILDTFGELGKAYSLATVAFMGNSLALPGGGQNLLQPLAQGKPVITGPHMHNFRDLHRMAVEQQVCFTATDADSLADRIITLIKDKGAQKGISRKATALISDNRGAAERYAMQIERLLSEKAEDEP